MALPPAQVSSPWTLAKVGQSFTYRTPGGTTIYKVKAVDNDSVTVQMSVSGPQGTFTSEQAFPTLVPYSSKDGGIPPSADWSRDTLTVSGRQLTCRVATWTVRGSTLSGKRTVWLCEGLPVRTVKSAQTDTAGKETVLSELVEMDLGE
jgi:hypothetical protein